MTMTKYTLCDYILSILQTPMVSVFKVKESRWKRYRVWKPLSLMVLAGLTPPEWEISIVDENPARACGTR